MSKKVASPNFEPRLVTSNKTAARQRINADAGSGGVNFTLPQPFRPEFGDESRVFYPIDRLQANRHNQLYYKVDGTIGTVIDMYAEIIGSQFHLSGEGIEGEVKDAFELSLEKTRVIAAFPMFIKYYLVFGECIPHLTFDKNKRIWTTLMFHNPDQISVTNAPLLGIPDILEFTPDETLRKLARSNHPVIQAAMSALPPEVLAALISGQGIPLDTITNVTFLARKQFAHETRGTSILSRLYRILMIEDAVAQATIQTARRHAGPLKIAKVGMMLPDGNPWMPEVGFEDKLVQLLATAETDPHSFLILPWHVQFEAFGTTDRMLSLRNEYETIEKIKLVGLGVSSEFLHGTATYNSMKGQLQVLMMRMSNLRNYFEHMWWIPKFFRPMSELNGFIKPTDAEVNHRVRFRRSKKELLEDNRYIIPTMNWVRQLDPKVDDALLDTYEQIVVRLGQPLSRSTVLAAANLDKEVEDKNLKEEARLKSTKEKKPSGGGGDGELSFSEEPTEAPIKETPEETIELEVPGASKQSKKIPTYQEDLETFIDFVQTKKPTKFWARILKKDEKPEEFINKLGSSIERVVDFLDSVGYNHIEVEGFKRDLSNEVDIPVEVKEDIVASLVDSLDTTGSGKDIDNAIDTFIKIKGKDLGLEPLIGKGRLRELDLVNG